MCMIGSDEVGLVSQDLMGQGIVRAERPACCDRDYRRLPLLIPTLEHGFPVAWFRTEKLFSSKPRRENRDFHVTNCSENETFSGLLQ